MKLIGITGGIGMGKSASGEILKQRALPLLDTDIIARRIVDPGQPALLEIEEAFGAAILGADGSLRRDQLAKKVFSDAAALRKLEDILHPRIRKAWLAEVQEWKTEGRAIGFVIIPLLFETNAASHFDAIICVACSEKTQRERLRNRGWSDQQLQQRIDAQWPVQKKIDAAHFVIWTETSLEVHGAQLDHLLLHHLR